MPKELKIVNWECLFYSFGTLLEHLLAHLSTGKMAKFRLFLSLSIPTVPCTIIISYYIFLYSLKEKSQINLKKNGTMVQ